jgi:hypothetical protein
MRRDSIGRADAILKELCCGRVARGPLTGREVMVDGRAHDRVHEAQPHAGGEDPCGAEPVRRCPPRIGTEAGDRRGERELRVVAEHGGRPRELDRLVADELEARARQPRHGVRPDLADERRGGGHGLDRLRPELAQELLEEEGVAAGGLAARAGEHGFGLAREALRGEPRHAFFAERARTQHVRPGAHCQALQEVLRLAGLAGARGHHQCERHAGDPPGEVLEELERRRVGAMRVVDEQEQRSAVGNLDRQPVQPGERGEASPGARQRLRPLEQRARECRRALEEGGALVRREYGQRRLEDLTGDPEWERGLELRPPSAKDTQAFRLGEPVGRLDQARLSEAGTAHHHDDRALAGLRRGQRPTELPHLCVAFE